MSTGQGLSSPSRAARAVQLLSEGVANFYLIEDGGRLTLIDAGTPADWDLLVQALAAQGKGLADLEAVVLTHSHADHIGFAERARTQAGACVRVHEADARVAKGGKPGKTDGSIARYLLRPEFYRTTLSMFRRAGRKIIPVLEVSAFRDGEILDVPGRPRVVQVPGHTPGSCALLLAGNRILLSGDAIVTRNPLTGRTGPQIMPSALNHNSRQALRSLKVLERLPADIVLPGHGYPWTGGAGEAARWARAKGRS